ALAPEYEIAATKLKDEKIPIAKVDCTEEADICSEHDVRGYPTLKVFRKGAASDYKGQRKADSIVSFMHKQSLPAFSKLTAETFTEFTTSENVVVAGFFADETSDDFKAFTTVAEKLRDDYLFGYTIDADLAKSNSATPPDVILYKKFDEGKNDFEGAITEEALSTFIKTNAIPLMDDIGPDNYGSYLESGVPLAYLFIATPEQRKSAGEVIEPFAKKYKGKINFVYIDATKFGGHGKNLNLKEEWPAFVIQETKAPAKFPFDQSIKIETEAISTFLEEYVSGKLAPSIKSEAEPTENDAPVKVVVGSTYESIVLNSDKDVLIELYAPWCGHCKKLAPIYDELAEKLASNKNIVIAKMDATENDLPASTPFQVQGFPTIKLYKAKDNEIVDFGGERTIEGFLEFIKAHAVYVSEYGVAIFF
ncbi:thioredoxin-like domain-containing protein, partial [Blyttiomyces helicus]